MNNGNYINYFQNSLTAWPHDDDSFVLLIINNIKKLKQWKRSQKKPKEIQIASVPSVCAAQIVHVALLLRSKQWRGFTTSLFVLMGP